MIGKKNACKVQGSVSEYQSSGEDWLWEGSVIGPLIFLVCIMETSMVA